jgi:hypothetical protein
MTRDGAGTGGEYDTGAYCPPEPATTSGAAWAGVGFAAAVLAVMVAAITGWIIHLRASAAPARTAPGHRRHRHSLPAVSSGYRPEDVVDATAPSRGHIGPPRS